MMNDERWQRKILEKAKPSIAKNTLSIFHFKLQSVKISKYLGF